MTETNKEKLAKFFEAAHKADEAGMLERAHSDFVVHEAAGMPYAGDYVGMAGWYDVFGKVTGLWKDVGIETTRIIGDENGDHFVVCINFTGKSPDRSESFATTMLEHWIFRDGKIQECWPHYWDTHAMRMMYERSLGKAAA
jgi:ketosteroid isomerase-like protein